MKLISRLFVASLLFALSAKAAVTGQLAQPDETLPGFKPNGVYDAFGTDNVNIYSGDLGIAIPLGPEYRASATFSWQLKAYYSAKLWTFYSCTTPAYAEPFGIQIINGAPTLGAGWTLDPGFLRAYPGAGPGGSTLLFYHSPDGGQHEFKSEAHAQTQEIQLRTVDGTKLRATAIGTGGYVVEFPDGSRHRFDASITAGALPNGNLPSGNGNFPDFPQARVPEVRWGLRIITDAFNKTVLEVTREAGVNAWKITQIVVKGDTGQQQPTNGDRVITFNWSSPSNPFYVNAYGDNVPVAWPVLNSISFPSVNNASLQVQFDRVAGTFRRTNSGTCDSARDNVAVPMLSGIRAIASGTTIAHTFTYENDPINVSFSAGAMKTMTLPTGGKITYEWNVDPLVTGNTNSSGVGSLEDTDAADAPTGPGAVNLFPPQDPDAFSDSTAILKKRTAEDPITSVTSVIEYKRYQQATAKTIPPHPLDPTTWTRRVIVKASSGNAAPNDFIVTKHLFHVGSGGAGGSEIVRRYYENAVAGASPIRTVIRCYEGSSESSGGRFEACGYRTPSPTLTLVKYENLHKHVALSREVTWYGVNPVGEADCIDVPPSAGAKVACWKVKKSGWNPEASEFATEETSIPATGPSEVLLEYQLRNRTTTTNWTPSTRTGWRWLPKLYSTQTVTDTRADSSCPGSLCTASSSTTFDATTEEGSGQVRSQSITDGIPGMPASGTGTTTSTMAYGSGSPTTFSVSASGTGFEGASSVTMRTFDNGRVLTAQRTGTPWKRFDVTRERYVGAITASRDPENLETTFQYDGFGRLLAIQPPGGEAATTLCYGLWMPPYRGAYVLVKRGIANPCSFTEQPAVGSGTFEAYYYDGFGRLVREAKLLPNQAGGVGSYFGVRETKRNAAGFVESQSEWSRCSGTTDVSACFSGSIASKTQFSNFDFLGRPRKIVAPDGRVTTKSFNDIGVAAGALNNSDTVEFTTVEQADVNGVLSSVTSATRKDVLGRTILATDPWVGTAAALPGDLAIVTYLYNVLDKLVEVRHDRSFRPLGSTPETPVTQYTQRRYFTYDAHGLLRSEQHPEKAQETYRTYDALGNLVKSSLGTLRHYDRSYDSEGRLTLLSVNVGSFGPSGTPYVENVYDAPGQKGKLSRRTSRNPEGLSALDSSITSPTAPRISEDEFFYSALSGRLTKIEQNASYGGKQLSTDYSLTYNNLGLTSSVIYPRSVTTGTRFSTATTYAAGFPTGIQAGGMPVISGVTYDASGGLSSYTAGNGVVTTIEGDASGMSRPRRIRAELGGSLLFDTGVYAYDGAGNITAIGFDAYRYDAFSRLTYAAKGSGVTGSEAFEYDPYGNLWRRTVTGFGASQDPPPETYGIIHAKNQLSTAFYGQMGEQWYGAGWYRSFDSLTRIMRVFEDFSIPVPGNARRETFFYDASGERRIREVRTADLAATPPDDPSVFTFLASPCRMIDTRNIANGTIPGNSSKDFGLYGGTCGVPYTAKALAVNTTALGWGGSPGELRLFPRGLPAPTITTNAFEPWVTQATFTMLKPDSSGYFTVQNTSPTGKEFILDIMGYWSPDSSSRPAAATTGVTWFAELRDPSNRLLSEIRFDHATEEVTVLKDNVFLGNLRVATRNWAPSPGEPLGWQYIVSDHLGSPRLTTLPSGATLRTERFMAFGDPMVSGNLGLGFAGLQKDRLGDWYDHARSLGQFERRFLLPDPQIGSAEDVQSWNRYSYARNNPSNLVDVDGRAYKPSKGLTTFASIAAGFLPYLGEAQDATILLTGYDPISAQKVSAGTRKLSGVSLLVPLVGTMLVSRMMGGADEVLDPQNAKLFDEYKQAMIRQMEKPAVKDAELGKYMDELYRPGAKVGSGSTADAIRHERATGQFVGGKSHTEKGLGYVKALEGWLKRNPTARAGDRAAAENVLRDLRDALD